MSLPDRLKPEDFIAVIEIGKGPKSKYELDKETGFYHSDRVPLHLHPLPRQSYGFIPRTHCRVITTLWTYWSCAASPSSP